MALLVVLLCAALATWVVFLAMRVIWSEIQSGHERREGDIGPEVERIEQPRNHRPIRLDDAPANVIADLARDLGRGESRNGETA